MTPTTTCGVLLENVHENGKRWVRRPGISLDAYLGYTKNRHGVIYEGLFTRQLVDAYLFFFFTTRIFCSPVIHRGLSGGELVLKEKNRTFLENSFS